MSWFVGIDIGGTFTDVVAVNGADGRAHHLKVASDPAEPANGVRDGLAALRDEADVEPHDMQLLLHGTTLATNAIIERRLPRTGLITTHGFRDVLEIGRHWRAELYNPFADQAPPLIPRELRLEVTERTSADGTELEPLDREAAAEIVELLTNAGVNAVAVVFLHAYARPEHEEQMAALLRAKSSWYICASSELSREVREYERTSTTVLNAALMPLVDDYLTRLEEALAGSGSLASLLIMQSNGGALTPPAARARPVTLALSGPAAGVMACVDIGKHVDRGSLIGLDMGGTSADISIVVGHEPRYTAQLTLGELPIRLPSVEIRSIGAGGGSIASVDSGGSLRVGPESAGSTPGPACYARGGTEPTITDAQLVLGRLDPDEALGGQIRLDAEAARRALRRVAEPLDLPIEEAAAGIVEVANAAMERAIRVALRARGDDPREFALVAFGGAGPLHAVELAQRLAIRTVVVPPYPGTLSALGLLTADVRMDFATSEISRSDQPDAATILRRSILHLEDAALKQLRSDSHLADHPWRFDRSCDVRYVGQAYEVTVPITSADINEGTIEQLLADFHDQHQRAYGFASPADPCELVTYRVAANVLVDKAGATENGARQEQPELTQRDVYMPSRDIASARIQRRESLQVGTRVEGPAVIHHTDATTLIPEFAVAEVDRRGNLLITIDEV